MLRRIQADVCVSKLMIGNKPYTVQLINPKQAYELILTQHYAKRIPSLSFCFGLFDGEGLVGVCSYGTPPSSTLCRGICGDQFQKIVLELNRLVLKYNRKNEASALVAQSLKMLPKPTIVVSFADTAQQHTGIVYQAANFLYTGLSAKFKDPMVKGLEHQHHATYGRGLTNKQIIEKYGAENVYFKDRARKHRYIFFVGSKSERKRLLKELRYQILPYPKEALT